MLYPSYSSSFKFDGMCEYILVAWSFSVCVKNTGPIFNKELGIKKIMLIKKYTSGQGCLWTPYFPVSQFRCSY